MEIYQPDRPGDLLRGRFKLISAYRYTRSHQWKLFKYLGHQDIIWEFVENPTFTIYNGVVMFHGKLREHFKSNPAKDTAFNYYPVERMLQIDRSDHDSGGICSMYIHERYRVEYIAENYYWIYDLESVEKEPEDYFFRFKLERM